MRRSLPDCRIALIVDENTEKRLADRVRQARKDGLTYAFIYSAVSAKYPAAITDAL